MSADEYKLVMEAAIKAIEISKEWSVWLVGGGIAFVAGTAPLIHKKPYKYSSGFLNASILSFGLSILVSTLALSGYPSLVFEVKSRELLPLRFDDILLFKTIPLGVVIFFQHLFFLASYS